MSEKRYAVLAGNRRQFDEFVDWFRHDPDTKKAFFFAGSEYDLHGARVDDVFVIGTFYQSRPQRETRLLLDLAHARMRL